MRVMNIVSKAPEWVVVAYMPQVRSRYEAMSQSKAAEARAEILQRTIALVFRDVMLASHFGADMTLPDGVVVNISPRLILYVSDQPEERDVVCLKRHGSAYDCTPCMARSTSSGVRPSRGNSPKERNVLKTVKLQLKGARMRGIRGNGVVINAIETANSIHCVVPALAGWAGLGSGPLLLYQIFGFDRLHVRCTFLSSFDFFLLLLACDCARPHLD